MNLPKTRVDKLRAASKVVWGIGALLTFNFAREVAQPDGAISFLITMVVSAGIQYIFTLSLSVLISGLPVPWKEAWNPRLTVIWFGGIVCLLLDVLLNIGGGQYILEGFKRSSTNSVLTDQFGATSGFISFVTGLMIVLLGTFFALGSEIFNAQADYLEEKIVPLPKSDLTMVEHRGNIPQQERGKSPLLSERKGNRNNG